MGESSREMRFSVSSPPPGGTAQKGRGDAASVAGRPITSDESNSSSDFNQWLHAMKMVARLPGGMPPEFRRKLWLALADKYLKSKNVDWEKEEVKCFSEQWREDDEELGIQIVKDLHRTGSSLCSGPAGTINQAKLKRILLGYARFNPEVGYCQGFNMLGALILQVMDKEEIESIKVMVYLVEGILPSGYFSGSLGGLQADMAVFRELMTSKLPRLAKHLQKLQGPVENAFEPPLTNVFTMQWFLTMFCTCLPMTCVLRVWDLVLIEGSDVLLRTALVLWSLLEERILNARTADDFYCQMGSFSSELLNGHLVDSNGLIEKVVELGPVPELQKLRDKHLYNITPFRDKKGLQLYYSDEDGDSDEDSRMAVATAWGLRLRRGSAGLGSKSEGKDRIALDISLLKKQYDRLRERQRQAHIILTSAVARQGSNPNQSSIQMNQLLIGRNAIVTNNGRRLGPPQGAIPPARKPSLPTSKPPKLAQTKKLLSGETLHWRDTDLSKRRRESLKWKDIKSDSSLSGQDDRPTTLIESAPSSRSSSSEPKSKRISMKASRQRSDSSSYSEESDGNSSTSTSLCDEDDIADHTLSSLEGSPMRKSKSSKKHSEVTKQKSLEDVLNSNDGKPTIDNQIPFIQLTTIESPVLNANKNDIDALEFSREDSETESNRLDYAGFVDEFSWPEINEPTSSISLEDTTIDATSVEGDFLSLSNVITSTSQLSPIPDITTYINNSNISPLRTPISAFDYVNLVVSMDDSKKFDVNEEGVTNKYFERVNIVERPTKLDLLYSLNEEDSIRNAYVSCKPSPESSKENLVLDNLNVPEPENGSMKVVKPKLTDEEVDRKMKVLLEYSNQSSLSFIAEAKHEISSGIFKEAEFDAESLKYQPTTLIPLKKASPKDLTTHITDNTVDNVVIAAQVPNDSKTMTPSEPKEKENFNSEFPVEKGSDIQVNDSNINTRKEDSNVQLFPEETSSSSNNFVQDDLATDLNAEVAKEEEHESNLPLEGLNNPQLQTKADSIVIEGSSNIPSTEDLETRFRALEKNFTGRKESLRNEVKQGSPTEKTPKSANTSKEILEETGSSAKRLSVTANTEENLSPDRNISNILNDDIEPSKETRNITSVYLKEEENPSFANNMADKLKDGLDNSSSSPKDESITLDKYEPSAKTRENNSDCGSLSPNKEPISNYDRMENTSDAESIIGQNIADNKQHIIPHEETEKHDHSSSGIESAKKDLMSTYQQSENINTVIEFQNEKDIQEAVVIECTEKDKQPSLLQKIAEQLPSSLDENSVKKDQKATRTISSTEEQYINSNNGNQKAVEEALDKTNTEELNESLISEEITKEPTLSSTSIKQSNEDWDSSHHQHEYQVCDEESMKPENHEGQKQSSLVVCLYDKEISTPSSNEDSNPFENNVHEQDSASEKITENAENTDKKETSVCNEEDFQRPNPMKEPSIEDADPVDQQSKDHSLSDELEVNHQFAKEINTSVVNDEDVINPLNIEESTTDFTKTGDQNGKILEADFQSQSSTNQVGGKPKNDENKKPPVPKEGEVKTSLNELKKGVSKPIEHNITHSAELLKEENPTSLPKAILIKDVSSDIEYHSNIEDPMVKNLSDDNKQSMLPKDEKRSLITKKMSSEDIFYYQHHSANEDGSEIEGSNDPEQTEDQSFQCQSDDRTDGIVHEKDTVEEKSVVQTKSDELSLNDFKDEDQSQQRAMLTTADQPLSTYSFSYTQDHFRDRVSLLSEVQSSSDKKVSNALKSTVDLQHLQEGSIAVTTSVSVKNSASLKASFSVKSSVSLKSSSLYDRERSLHVNTGVTVFEDQKYSDLKMISSNEVENSDRSKKENVSQLHKPLNETHDNAVNVSVVKSVFKDLQHENKSSISLSMQLSPYPVEQFGAKHLDAASILDRESSQSVDTCTLENINKESCKKEIPKKNLGEGSEGHAVDQSQNQKSPFSQELDERFKTLERRFSERSLPLSADSRMPTDQLKTKDEKPKKQQDVNVEDGDPRTNASSSSERVCEEEIIRPIPSTVDLEHRFRELERKLSEKNINLSTETEKVQEKSNQSNTNLHPSIVLSKNDNSSPVRLCDDSVSGQRNLEGIEGLTTENQATATRKRIPSTEDLETRFEALEIQKALKSPTNLLSPSKINEDFLASTPKSDIPSTEDLENRFQAFEESKKVNRSKPPMQSNLKQNILETESGTKNNSEQALTDKTKMAEGANHGKTSTKDPERKCLNLKQQHSDNDLRTKTKDIPKVTFAEIEPLGHAKPFEEAYAETEEAPTCGTNSERVLRKVPSARDLEARFEALEKRKSFTGFSTKIQEHLLSEQNRNFLSSESLNSVESLKRREANDKKVASTEDLVQRLDALEQRMAITENSIKTNISTHSSDSPKDKKQIPSAFDLESKFESMENRKSFTDTSSKTRESNNISKTASSKDKFTSSENLHSTLNSSKDISQEMKLSLIKRSLFEDKEPETKNLPSTKDLESRFDALEQQKTKSLSIKKKTSSGQDETKEKFTAYEPTPKSTQNWEVLEYHKPNLSSYAKTKPSWERESQSKLPSTKDLESRFEALEQQKSKIDRCSKMKGFKIRSSNEKDLSSTFSLTKPKPHEMEKHEKDLVSRSIDEVLEQICSKTNEIEREHKIASKVPSTQDLEIRYHDLQINSKRGDESDLENVQILEQTTDSQELAGKNKRRDLYKLESQSDETLTATDPSNTEFETKAESRPTSCPEYRDPFDSNIVTTDRVLKIIEENSKILHRILKKTLADSGSIENATQPGNSRSGLTDSLLALGNIFPRSDESISPSRIISQSRVRSTITFRSDDSSITDRLASIKSTIKSIDTLCEDQSFRKDKCQRYIDSLFTTRPTNATSPTPPVARPIIKVDDFESSSRHSQERVAMRELKKETSPRRRRDEDREEYESRVRRDLMPNSVDAPSEFSCSLENIAKVDSEVDRINQNKQVETQLERPSSPYYAPGYDLTNRSITPVVYIPTKLEIRHTTVTSTFYDRYLTEKHIERTFPRSKKHSPVSPSITKSYLDISRHASPNLDDRSSKSAENSPSRRKDGLSPNQTVSAADYKRSFISSLEVAQNDLHIRSCDNILLQLRSSTRNSDVLPSIMVYNPLPTKIRKPPELAISLGLYKDYGSDASSKS